MDDALRRCAQSLGECRAWLTTALGGLKSHSRKCGGDSERCRAIIEHTEAYLEARRHIGDKDDA